MLQKKGKRVGELFEILSNVKSGDTYFLLVFWGVENY